MPDEQPTEAAVRDAFRQQAVACERLGSPFTARLSRIAAERLDAGAGPIERRLLSWPQDARASGDSVPLRLAGALHALVLAGADTVLAAHWPPSHDCPDDATFWSIIRAALERHETAIDRALDSPPQTNEVRRSSTLVAGYLAISATTGLPLRVAEIGASAGLNLIADRYRHTLGDRVVGDPGSPLRLIPEWRGAAPPPGELDIRERRGCDLRPFDLTAPDQRTRLLSYVWADQTARLDLHRTAIDLASVDRPQIYQQDAICFLREEVRNDWLGRALVISHTIVWQYLPENTRFLGERLIAEAGETASRDAPLAWLRLEDDGKKPGAGLLLTLWPKGETYHLGRADFHGRWIDWR